MSKPFSKTELKEGRDRFWSKKITNEEFQNKFGYLPNKNKLVFNTEVYFYNYEKRESKLKEGEIPKDWFIVSTTTDKTNHLVIEWTTCPWKSEELISLLNTLKFRDKISLTVERILIRHSLDTDPLPCGKKWIEKFIVREIKKVD